jgi:hypothetical protein
MPEIHEGTVTVQLPEGIEVPEKAGNLSDDAVRRLVKVRRGVGLTAMRTATEMESAGEELTVPKVTSAELRSRGQQADMWDEIIADLQVALRVATQANLLVDAEVFNMLRKVNNQVKAQADFDPKVKARFSTVLDYFGNTKRKKPLPEDV